MLSPPPGGAQGGEKYQPAGTKILKSWQRVRGRKKKGKKVKLNPSADAPFFCFFFLLLSIPMRLFYFSIRGLQRAAPTPPASLLPRIYGVKQIDIEKKTLFQTKTRIFCFDFYITPPIPKW